MPPVQNPNWNAFIQDCITQPCIPGIASSAMHTNGAKSPNILFRPLEQLLENIPARVGRIQRVVEHVAVAIMALGVVRELYHGVGLHKAPQRCIIDTPVHVDDAHRIEHLMAGVAAGGVAGIEGHQRQRRQLPPGHGIAPLPPGIVAQRPHHRAHPVRDDRHTAQVVLEQVLPDQGLGQRRHPVRAGGALVGVRQERRPAGKVALVGIAAAGGCHLLHRAEIQRRRGRIVTRHRRAPAVRVRALGAGPVRAVGEADGLVALDDALNLVESVIRQRAPGPRQLAAVGIVAIRVAPRRRHRMGTGCRRGR